MKVHSLGSRRIVRTGGFTLIELMIAVAIVGILVAIALPAYRDSVIKGKRAQGRTALHDFALAQERYYTANNTYLVIATPGGSAAGMKTYSGDNATTPSYLLSATSPCFAGSTAKDCVILTAVPQFNDPQAGSLTMLTTGAKSCSGSNSSVCWP